MDQRRKLWTRRDFIKIVTGGAAIISTPLLITACDRQIRETFDTVDQGRLANGRYTRPLKGQQQNVYFGDLHAHSNLSPDCLLPKATPDAFYQYAIEVSKLDFATLTDHDCPPGLVTGTPEEWAKVREVARKYHTPGKFVTYPAYEWTSGNGWDTLWAHRKGQDRWAYLKDPTHFGHRNVFFPTDDVPERIFAVCDPDSDTPEKLWEALKPYGAITIPHHPLGGPVPPIKWEHHNPEMEPLVEIYSLHGNSETESCPHLIYNAYLNGKHSVQHALGRGYRLGFIGSSDSHAARPGTQDYKHEDFFPVVFKAYNSGPKLAGGLAAVYAPSCTREAIWDSLINRRTYATSGSKMMLDLTVDGRFMGSEFSSGNPVTVNVRAIGTEPLSSIEVLKNSEVVYTRQVSEIEETLEYRDQQSDAGEAWFYVRVTQKDGEIAWSSPVWVDYS